MFVLDNTSRVCNALVDKGSTHSFLSPSCLNAEQLQYLHSNRHKLNRKLFHITSATGTVNFILSLDVEIGEWTGKSQFVISSKISNHEMVLGRDF